MSLYDLVDQAEKTAAEEDSGEEYTDEEIKEAYAAGRIAGAAYADELGKLAQKAKKDDKGVAYKEDEGSDAASSEQTEQSSDGEATVDKKRKDINRDQKATKDTNNDQSPEANENSKETDGPQQNDPQSNKDHSVTAAAERVLDVLSN